MRRAAWMLWVMAGCQAYDFEPVSPFGIAQTVKRVTVAARPLKPDLFLVVDKSGSMLLPADPTCTGSCSTRMDELKVAMRAFLTASGSAAHLGMMPYPADNACGPGQLSAG